MITREKLTLADGKDAMKITGLGDPFLMRVKRTRIETKGNGHLTDTLVYAAAYLVDDTGKEQEGTVGPEVGLNVHGSSDLNRGLASLSARAQAAYVSARAAAVQQVPENLPI